MKTAFKYLVAAILAFLALSVVAMLMLRAGVDLVALDERLQGLFDVFRLAHLVAWLALFVRWPAAIDWCIGKGWLRSQDRAVWYGLKAKIMTALAAYILIVVVGPARLFSIL
ncbi:hypothetical protein D8I35_03250 [Corticibacter populi]|uniref:Uncharacterized protein n=2 Tax=Corticibacter populi TaxID=1550736 RepID=A0A3M6QZV8_9BURK|nr:hypothetical protein D8I35_03250 [Corticibacter populi]